MSNLVQIKILHTAIWFLFAGCIVAIPIVGARGHYVRAAVLIGLVLVDCGVLAANRWTISATGSSVTQRDRAKRLRDFDIEGRAASDFTGRPDPAVMGVDPPRAWKAATGVEKSATLTATAV